MSSGDSVRAPGEAPKDRIVLAIAGSIAAYKGIEVARLLVKAGADVIPILTESATRFVGAMSLSAITGHAVHTTMWDAHYPGELHVDLASTADAVVIAPATADMLARLAQGRANDLVTSVVLCTKAPLVIAPAMHPSMWQHPAVQRNARDLAMRPGVRFVGPVDGPVASGESGWGRLAEPQEIVDGVKAALATQDWRGRSVLVTAGPTWEPLDPVRYLGNRSSGTMGFAIAECAAQRGAKVVLVSGPVSLRTPYGVERRDVETAVEMRDEIDRVVRDVPRLDAIIMAAAVADFRPAEARAEKVKKERGVPSFDLVANPDILAELGVRRLAAAGPALIGFALETGTDDEALVRSARDKLVRKNADLVIANLSHESLGRTTARVALVSPDKVSWVTGTKVELARDVLDRVLEIVTNRASAK